MTAAGSSSAGEEKLSGQTPNQTARIADAKDW
jgi:hypothetical protein